jgi:hypothetical protein
MRSGSHSRCVFSSEPEAIDSRVAFGCRPGAHGIHAELAIGAKDSKHHSHGVTRTRNLYSERMPTIRYCVLIVAILVESACDSTRDTRVNGNRTLPTRSSADSLVVGSRASAGTDTVYVAQRDEWWSVLVWQARVGPDWHSRNIHIDDSEPRWVLTDLNGDGVEDLFWSVPNDGSVDRCNASGVCFVLKDGHVYSAVVTRSARAVHEIAAPFAECREGEVKDVDGLRTVVFYSAGAIPGGACDDPLRLSCDEEFGLAWPDLFTVVGDSLHERRGSAAYYRRLADAYRKSATQLDSLIRVGATTAGGTKYEDLCGVNTPHGLRSLADSAASLAHQNRQAPPLR